MTISINKKTDKFFLAIGKENKHTFLMFGVYDQNRVGHLLCRVGKDVDETDQPVRTRCKIIARQMRNVFFSKLKSKLRNERTYRNKPGNIPISYQAYDTTYEHYLEFIQLLESIQTTNNIFPCDKPINEQDDIIEFIKTSIPICVPRSNLGTLKSKIDEFTIGNTCRHTAIDLVEEVQKVPISPMVSSGFFIDLPYRTNLVHGKPSDEIPFYVLPLSPKAFPDLSEERKRIIEKLYLRMEHLVLLEPDSTQTVNKFNSLKSLYTQMVGPQKQLNLNELLYSIQSWKEQNKSTLSALRKTYFWDAFFTRKSATMIMISEIEHDLVQAQKDALRMT